MPNTNKVSKYLFDQVEARLDAIKLDGAGDKYLADDGQYKEIQIPNSDVKIGDLNTLTTTAKDSVVNAVNELESDKADKTELDAYTKTDALTNLLDGKADKATDLAGYGITDAYTKVETDANIKVVADKVGDLTTLTTTDQDSVVNSINELVTNKAEKTDLDDFVTLDEVKNEINQAQLGGAGQVDLSIYQTKADVGEVATLDTTAKTVVEAINEIHGEMDGKANITDVYPKTDTYSKTEIDNKLDTKADKSTTLNGYGITDAYSKTESDNKYQTKLTGSLGQIVGFDENGNAIAREYEITPDWATFIVEDNATLEEWRTKANSKDYSKVYIKKGDYTVGSVGTLKDGKYYVFNLTEIGTKQIYAEEGTTLKFTGAYYDNAVIEMGYEVIPSDLGGYSAEGITIIASVDSMGSGTFAPSCFYNMINLTNCTAKSSSFAKTDNTSILAVGFNQCKNLIRCTSAMSCGKRDEATAHVGSIAALGYKDCDKLLQCSGEAVATSDSGATKLRMFGYETCKDMVQCVGTVNHKYVVIAIAGQSNAVGYDESPIDVNFISRSRNEDRIKQLGFYGKDNLKIIPLGYCAQNMQDMRTKSDGNPIQDANGVRGTKGIQLPLANLMLDYIPDDYDILVLPIAYGGTGFTGNRGAGTYNSVTKKPNETGQGEGAAILKWGVGTAYYQTLRDRIIYSLELNESNLFAGIIWCQGENDKGKAQEHYTAFQNMTSSLFSELNSHNGGALKSRVPKKTWDADIWYNMETVSHWYSTEDCSDIWRNYKEWNEKTYIEIPRDTESNAINGTGQTTQTKPRHFGNNAYQKVVAPRVLQKMIDMDTFTKKVNVIEKEIEIPIVVPEVDPDGKTHEDERLITDSDVTRRSQGTVLTIDANGNCTANKALRDSYNTDKTHIIFKDFYKMEFKVSRSMYWLVIEQDTDADSVVVVGFGKSYTTRIVQITKGTISQTPIKEADGSKNKTFHKGHRIRIYRETNGNIVIYEKGNSGIWYKWLEISSPNVLKEKVLGFCAGIAGNEFSDNFATDDMKLFEDMSVWQASPSSTTREIDMRLTSIERPYDKYKEERDAIAGDIVSQSSGSTFSLNGSKNIVASATIDTTKVQKVYLKDVFKLEFNVNRAIYHLVLRKNSANDDVLVCEIGGANTGRISTINTANQKTVLVNSATQHILQNTDKIRVYRDGNGSVHVYLKKQSTTWTKVATVSGRHEFDKQLFGFVVGLSNDETNSSIGVSDTLLSSLKVWETEPFPLARVFDIRTSN